MSLSSVSLRRPVFATVMNIVIVIFGVIGYKYLGVREYPAIDPPIINVRTNYAGANAEVVESQITEPLEKSINGIADIRSITSTSAQGVSQITVEFNLDADMEAAANDVRDKVSQATRLLPQDLDAPPVVSKADANSDAIISMTVQSDTRNQLELSDYAANVLQERIQTIPGVSSVQIWGEKKYAMRIWLDPLLMAARNVTFQDVQQAFGRENLELPSGKVYGDLTELGIRTLGRLRTEEEFSNLIIRNQEGAQVRLQDIGQAILGPENEESALRESGVRMVALAIIPQPGANYVEISDEFYRRYDQLKREVPKDISLNIALDSTKFVKQSIAEVEETLLIAFALVVLVIYLFFRDWLIAVRPLVDIPISLVATFFFMYLFGFSINVLTMLAIVLATGLVVDDGIVVTENIYKKIEAGMPVMKAAKEGSEEIYFAVISTSITLAFVFLPIIFMDGFVGALFREFGMVVAMSVLVSAFVSLTITPVLNVKLARKDHKHSWFYEKTEPFFRGMEDGYRDLLQSFLKRRWLSWAMVLLCGGIIFLTGKALKSELAPMEDRSFIGLSLSTPEGTSFDAMDATMMQVGTFLTDSIPEKSAVLSVTSPGFGTSSINSGFMRLALKDPQDRERSQKEVLGYINKNLQQFPNAKIFAFEQPTISVGRRGGLPVQFVLQNNDFEKLRKVLPEFLAAVAKDSTFTIADADLKFNKPEVQVTVDRQKATEMGVSVSDISQTLQLAYANRRIGYFDMNGKQYQVLAQVDRNQRDEVADISTLYVRNNSGQMVSLENLVLLQEQTAPQSIPHFNRYKSATVSAALAPGKTMGEGIASMQAIADTLLDESFATSLSGQSRDFAESSSSTGFALGLALVLIFLILAAQFESFVDPVIIMVTVPLAAAGALASLWLTDQTLNIFSQIGMIMLIGLVTKNGILIVEFANQLRDQGMEKWQATLQASVLRLRPILMTTLTMVLGTMPLALSLGAASQSRVPLGVVLVGGLTFSLVLTLFVVPGVYTYLARPRRHEKEALAADQEASATH